MAKNYCTFVAFALLAGCRFAVAGFLLLVVSIYGKLLKLYGNLFASLSVCVSCVSVCVLCVVHLVSLRVFAVVIVFPLSAGLPLFY